MYKIKDSGKREIFSTGARRDVRECKGRFDLLPAWAIEALAIHFELGSKKYGDNNWLRGIPATRFLDSTLRHVFKFKARQTDENHLIAAVWNLLCLYETLERVRKGVLPPELDDLPEIEVRFKLPRRVSHLGNIKEEKK